MRREVKPAQLAPVPFLLLAILVAVVVAIGGVLVGPPPNPPVDKRLLYRVSRPRLPVIDSPEHWHPGR